jgi:predicted AlkP superfamily phosphohydrolase/phosphomutase
MKTIIVGFDAFDPEVFEPLFEQGKMPHLGRYVKKDGYRRFNVSNPAQSEVSWTSICTGLNPGAHGLFDFVHRNPANYALYVSLLPTVKGLMGLQFTQPHQSQTLFDYAVEKGYPATALWFPAMFPARLGSPVQHIPGLGTPDIFGRLGVGNLYSNETWWSGQDDEYKTQLNVLKPDGRTGNTFTGEITGPGKAKKGKVEEVKIPFWVENTGEDSLTLRVGKQSYELNVGAWSPIIELNFKMGFGISIKAVTRALVRYTGDITEIYFLPLQLHPFGSPWPYASPRNYIRKTWKNLGPFLTLGWPQDTTALEEKFITDDQFLTLCDSIMNNRQNVFAHQLDNFEEGVLGIVFDSLDRVQHMFSRDRQDVIEAWYLKLDALFGRILEQAVPLGDDTRILVVSDHGFSSFDHKVHLNRFLIDQGFLHTKEPGESGGLDAADWSQTRAYAVGLNSVYLNLAGREGQGILPVDEIQPVLGELKDRLEAWKDPDGGNVVQQVYLGSEVFEGPLVDEAPDLVVGYRPGYRASSETGLGKWGAQAIEKNQDHWGADHCVDHSSVQGVLFCNHGLADFPNPGYPDFPPLAVGAELKAGPPKDRPKLSQEDQEAVEERLKGLGYL